MHIEPSVDKVNNDNSVDIKFNNTMNITEIGEDDLLIEIQSIYKISYSWTARYADDTTLNINIDISSVLEGGETLTISFINYKKYRSPGGGCLTSYKLITQMKSTLFNTEESSRAVSSVAAFSTYTGLIVTLSFTIIGGGSLEMIWALINTLQLISYLPLMTPYFPEHVRIMFFILKFANCDFELLANMFKYIISYGDSSDSEYSQLFTRNGIESPLFLGN